MSRSPATAEDAMGPGNIKLPEQPVETELLQIVLGDLDEFRFDLDLLRSGDVGLLDEGIDQLEVVLRIAHDQPAALRKEVCTRARREWHALAFQEFPGAFAIDELMTAGRFLRVLGRTGTPRTRRPGRSVERGGCPR